jgi:hypothetical protein
MIITNTCCILCALQLIDNHKTHWQYQIGMARSDCWWEILRKFIVDFRSLFKARFPSLLWIFPSLLWITEYSQVCCEYSKLRYFLNLEYWTWKLPSVANCLLTKVPNYWTLSHNLRCFTSMGHTFDELFVKAFKKYV